VPIDPDALPDDAAILQQMLRALLLEHGELHAENDKLRLLVQRFVRHQFGRRSEQLSSDQLQLGLEDLEQTRSPPIRLGKTRSPVRRASPARSPPRAITAPCRRTCHATRW